MLDLLLGLMVLAWPLVVLGLFVLVGIVVVTIAWRVGRSEGRKWGRWMAFWFLLFAFWDTPLVLGHFGYGCLAEAGFHEYKTVEQWKAENPGVAETLVQVPMEEWLLFKKPRMNQRFEFHSQVTRHFTGVIKEEEWVLDIETNEVMARYANYRTNDRGHESELTSPRTYKIWLNWGSCDEQDRSARIQFNTYVDSIKDLGR